MPDSTSRLPARPNLEQLRKRARELLTDLRAGNPDATLADAQLAIARQHGFDSWPKLVHHVESVRSSARLEQYELTARDILAGYHGDVDAIQRIGALAGASYSAEQMLVRIKSRVHDWGGTPGDPTLDQIRHMLAREYGFEDWAGLIEGLAQPPSAPGASRVGLSSTPPFYRIDFEKRRMEPQPPLSESDWDTVFAVMRERGLTAISGTHLTDAAMERLSSLEFVTSIALGGARGISDDGLLHLARMPQLEELELGGWYSPTTDRGLEVLRHLTSLRKFSLGWAQRVTDAGAAYLTFCDKLEEVNLLGSSTGDGAINALRGKRALRKFDTGRQVTDAGLPLLHDFPMFKAWHGDTPTLDLMSFDSQAGNLLVDGPFTNKGLASIAGLDGVSTFKLFWHVANLTADGLGALRGLANLVFLGVEGNLCDDVAMRHIAAIPKLRKLAAQGTVATDEGFATLSRSQTLEYFWGRECPNLKGRGFAAMAAMPALRGLGVSCTNVDDASLGTLPSFPALEQLMPMDVSDDGFRHVGLCEKLHTLWCMYCRDTGDVATEHVAALKLKKYYAGKTKITDRSLEVLARMSSLERLEFWEAAGITDAGVAALAALLNLKELSIEGSPRVTRAGVSVLPAHVKVNYST